MQLSGWWRAVARRVTSNCAAVDWRAVGRHLARTWDPRTTLRSLIPPGQLQQKSGTAETKNGPKKGGDRFAALTGARALALLWVLALHTMAHCIGSGEPAGLLRKWGDSWATQPMFNGDAGVCCAGRPAGLCLWVP